MLTSTESRFVGADSAGNEHATRYNSELLTTLETRRSVSARQLGGPELSVDELQRLLTIASRVPDHGALCPWRFIVIRGDARSKLSSALIAHLSDQLSGQLADDIARGKQKIDAIFACAPAIVVVVSRVVPASRIPEWEQVLSAGAVCMNMLTAAAALGYGANWLTGWAAYNSAALKILGVVNGEKIAGIIPIGRAQGIPPDRPRPPLDEIVSYWDVR